MIETKTELEIAAKTEEAATKRAASIAISTATKAASAALPKTLKPRKSAKERISERLDRLGGWLDNYAMLGDALFEIAQDAATQVKVGVTSRKSSVSSHPIPVKTLGEIVGVLNQVVAVERDVYIEWSGLEAIMARLEESISVKAEVVDLRSRLKAIADAKKTEDDQAKESAA